MNSLLAYCFSIVMLVSTISLSHAKIDNASVVKQTAQALTKDDKANLKLILERFDNFQASFTQKITDINGEELQSANGELLLVKPQKLRWEVIHPEESLLIADGQTVYNIDPFLEQVTLLEQDELTKNNPLMLLTTNDKNEWDQVVVDFIEEYYVLTSIDDDAIIVSVKLKFDENLTLTELISIDRQQQVNTISFSNMKQNIALDKDVFTYELKADWVVDDQRTIGN